MKAMKRILITALAIATGTTGLSGCSRLSSQPTKQIQVPDSGQPVLISSELPPQTPATQPAAGSSQFRATSQVASTAQAPAVISQASYLKPVSSGQAVKPFDAWTEEDAARDALGRIGAAAVPALVTALRDPDPAVRLKAVEVLGRMGDDAAAAVPDLIKLLDDPDPDVRKAATRTIGRIGPAAKAAVPALMQKLLESPSSP
jgi:hypothetical protein